MQKEFITEVTEVLQLILKLEDKANIFKGRTKEVTEMLQLIIKLEDKVNLFKGRINKLRR